MNIEKRLDSIEAHLDSILERIETQEMVLDLVFDVSVLGNEWGSLLDDAKKRAEGDVPE